MPLTYPPIPRDVLEGSLVLEKPHKKAPEPSWHCWGVAEVGEGELTANIHRGNFAAPHRLGVTNPSSPGLPLEQAGQGVSPPRPRPRPRGATDRRPDNNGADGGGAARAPGKRARGGGPRP